MVAAADDGIGMGEQVKNDSRCRRTSQPRCYHAGDVFANQMCPIVVDFFSQSSGEGS